jgi:nucleotide-binding universal stress UspA family protein
MKRLIIPTDFSDISKNSIIYGFQIAVKLNLEIQLIHVLELYKFAAGTSEAELISTILPADNIQEMETSANESFNKLFAEIAGTIPKDVVYSSKVVSGHLVNEMVIESAIDESALMILAVASSQDLITRFTHSTIAAIIAEAQCPVLVIPSNYSYKVPDKVVLATDFNKSDIDMLKNYIELFGQSSPEIQILHVASKPIDFKTELKFAGFKQLTQEKTGYTKLTFKLTNHKHVVQGIIESLKTDNADMLLMLKEHESFFKSLFEVSKTEKIAHYLKIPMISYHEINQPKK